MKIIKNLIGDIIVCGGLLFLFNYYSIGIKISFTNPGIEKSIIALVGAFVVLGFVFWVFNSPIKKILKIVSCPVNFLTLGLASIVINVLVFYLFAYVVNNYSDGEIVVKLGEMWQTLILSVIMGLGITVLTKIL